MGGQSQQKCPPVFRRQSFPPEYPQSSTTYSRYPQLSHSAGWNRCCTAPAHPAECWQTKRGTVLSPLDKHRAADEKRNPFEGDCAKASGWPAFVQAFPGHLDRGCSARSKTDSSAAGVAGVKTCDRGRPALLTGCGPTGEASRHTCEGRGARQGTSRFMRLGWLARAAFIL
jgi:hypothetical protein